jgi:DnaK suppressor protein
MPAKTLVTRPDLQAQFERLESSCAEAMERHRDLVRSMAGDTAGDDVADLGTKSAVSGENEAGVRHLVERRAQLEHALERAAAGTYGICETCGHPIPPERLAVFPGATSCVDCKQHAERSGRR